MNMTRERMDIVIEGGQEIKLETLAKVLSNTTKVFKKITPHSSDSRDQEFIVKDIKKGSFIIQIAGMLGMSKEFIEIAKVLPTTMAMFVNILDLKKHLQSKEASRVYETGDGQSTTVENFNGEKLIVNNFTFNTYTEDQSIEDSVTSIMKSLKDDSNVGSLAIVKNNGKSFEKKTYNPSELAEKIDVSKLNYRLKEDLIIQTVIVSKVDFVGNSKWTVHLNGNKINVEMKDMHFKANIGNYNFTLGTKMVVEMKVLYNVDKNGIPLKETKTEYIILKVNEVINDEDEQTRFFE